MINNQNKALDLVKKIPEGKITTYKIIGQKLKIKNYRAVSQILKNNPYPVKIPCHRVIKSNGELGGYKLGINNKIRNFKNYLIKF